LLPSVTVTLPMKLGTRFPDASRTLTRTAGAIGWPATVALGSTVEIQLAVACPG